MLYSPEFIPALHGAAGVLDELLLFGAPLVVVIIILIIASRRARPAHRQREESGKTGQNAAQRERVRPTAEVPPPPDSPPDSRQP